MVCKGNDITHERRWTINIFYIIRNSQYIRHRRHFYRTNLKLANFHSNVNEVITQNQLKYEISIELNNSYTCKCYSYKKMT